MACGNGGVGCGVASGCVARSGHDPYVAASLNTPAAMTSGQLWPCSAFTATLERRHEENVLLKLHSCIFSLKVTLVVTDTVSTK